MKHRDFAKVVTKVLRSSGIKAGIVADNGTTSPAGADKFEAYIPVKKRYRSVHDRLYMSFGENLTMDITIALNKEGFLYGHDGSQHTCFTFIPYPVEVCCRCKKHLAAHGWADSDSGKGVCSSCVKKS